jgi:hypothetical protein
MTDTTDLPNDDILELQTTLRGDASGAAAQALVGQLGRSLTVVQARLRQKLPQADFRAAEQLAGALEAAQQVVRKVWQSMHGRPLT